ncbi:MAG: ComF family protein [Longispora sp.]|nr:ComF family protein [Longispora sp. (in: high G+C Gram-positive bacteria)]
MLRDVLDLVLPADCPCTGPGPLCAACREVLTAAPRAARPTPTPMGFPECLTFGDYGGRLRGILLAYKERGRRDLTTHLADRLAVGAAVLTDSEPVFLIPVPATAVAARARLGDHMARLARRAALVLRRSGRLAVSVNGLRALPRPDSVGLTAAQRLTVAQGAFRARTRVLRRWPGAGQPGRGTVVLIDDVLTTGATLTAATAELRRAGVPVHGAVVLAATGLGTARSRRKALSSPHLRDNSEVLTGIHLNRG